MLIPRIFLKKQLGLFLYFHAREAKFFCYFAGQQIPAAAFIGPAFQQLREMNGVEGTPA